LYFIAAALSIACEGNAGCPCRAVDNAGEFTNNEDMEAALGILVGIGLSAACGFRVFVPLLVMSVASLSGHITLHSSFEWIGTYYALTAFLVASCLEALGFLFPGLDHVLDLLAAPAAIVAGTVVTASFVGDVSPFLKWSLAIIAGGGAAGIVQSATSATRVASSVTTAGIGNPFLSAAETGGSLAVSMVVIFVGFVVNTVAVTRGKKDGVTEG
jgi:hypothetical protein